MSGEGVVPRLPGGPAPERTHAPDRNGVSAMSISNFSSKVKTALMNAGFVLLISVMIFVILNDVAKELPNGWRSLVPFV